MSKAYYVKYRMHHWTGEKGIAVLADNKVDAYDKAVYEAIVDKEGCVPYSAWVASVTYQNGKYRAFNTLEGKPY